MEPKQHTLKFQISLNSIIISDKDIETLNWVNEGFVNISNKMKGKTKLPKTISYEHIDDRPHAQQQ